MTVVILLAMIFAGGRSWFVVLIAVLGFFLFAVRAVLQAWLLDATPPDLAGSAIGVLFGAQAAGAAIGPVCAGIIADRYGIMAAFYFLAAYDRLIANFMIFFTPSELGENRYVRDFVALNLDGAADDHFVCAVDPDGRILRSQRLGIFQIDCQLDLFE